MNLKDFSLLGEDDNSYTVGHPKGRSIQVDKSALSEKAHAAIQSLPKQNFDDGGAVSIPISTTLPQIPEALAMNAQDSSFQNQIEKEASQEQAQQAADGAPYGTATMSDQGPSPASIPSEIQTLNPSTQASPASSQFMPPNMNASLGAEEAAIKSGAAAESAEGSQNAKDIQNYVAQSQAEADAMKQKYQAFQDRDQKLEQAFSSSKIDPNRYWNEKSTGSKITAGIGLVLSGIGAGIGHSPNLAMEMMQRSIDRDIDAQKNDKSNAMNLWKMNREAYGNDVQASLATQNQLLGAVKAKALQSAAQAQGPMAQARIATLIQGIEGQKQENNWRNSLLNSQYSSPGQKSNIDPAQLVPMLVRNPEQQKQVYEEIGRAQNITRNSDKILSTFDQASKDNTVMQTGAGFVRTPGSVLALHQLMLPNFKQVDGTVRQAAMDESFHNLTPAPGDTDAKIALKRQALADWMHSETAAPTAKGNLIDLSRFSSTYGGHTAPASPHEGKTASNSAGQKIIMKNGKWVPFGG